MEDMRKELAAKGIDANFVAINGHSATGDVENLTATTAFPVLQEVESEQAWGKMGGSKDDLYVYGSDGKLAIHLPNGGTYTTDLSDASGWKNVISVLSVVK